MIEEHKNIHSGFRFLGPFIAAGPFWHATALSPEVLSDVDIDEFVFNSRLANEGSPFRPFLL